MDGQHHAPAALGPEKSRYLSYKRLGGPRTQPGEARKILCPPGFDSLTVQAAASRYTAYAIPAVKSGFCQREF